MEMFGSVAALVGMWTLLIFGVLRSMLAKNGKDLDEKIGEALSGIAAQDKKNQDLERRILELKAELPLNYVRKEDFIRHEVVINTKLDRLHDLIEDVKEYINDYWRNKDGK